MKRIKIGSILLMIGLVIFLIENSYFGWNKHPLSEMEQYADNVVRAFMYVGGITYFMPIWSLYENAVRKHEQSKKD
jgi:hypothetical protein